MRSSYLAEDVVLLLKDITGLVQPQSTEEREKLIQSGRHYSEMLPIEYVPTEKYMAVYRESLDRYAKQVADAVGVLADKIIAARGRDVVLVSLARAGTPIGILIKRYIKLKYEADVPHYSISIIRGRGIDDNAMKYLLDKYRPEQLLFVDGWIGKGAILGELEKDIKAYPRVSPEIAVVADPAGVTELCGTHEDILIPSSCLNSTISGLVSRTFLRDDIIGEKDFHGAVYYGELEDSDLSYEFIETIEKNFVLEQASVDPEGQETDATGGSAEKGIDEVRKIAAFFGIEDINFVKPGIGETTRVLLRRVPWKILIDERYQGDPELGHVVRLAEEKHVPVEYYPLAHYKCCGIIKKVADV
ncbi:MAG: cysteine protease StiP family protein [Acetatifactor sp.]|nr:cysteine protease StiP family protein [Acetatifactor sp.]